MPDVSDLIVVLGGALGALGGLALLLGMVVTTSLGGDEESPRPAEVPVLARSRRAA